MQGEGLGTAENDNAANNIMTYLSGLPSSEYSKWSDNYLGFQYLNGEGVQKNLNEAYNKFLSAARNDVPNAMLQVAVLYHNGEGTNRDLKKAKYWYKKASEHDIEEARNALNSSDFKIKKRSYDEQSNNYSYTSISESEFAEETENFKDYSYLNNNRIQTISSGTLWQGVFINKSIANVPLGDYVTILNTQTESPNYFYVEWNYKRGYMSTMHFALD